LNEVDQSAIRERFRRALLAALRNQAGSSGFSRLRDVCQLLERAAERDDVEELWRLAKSLCVALATESVRRLPQNLLLFRDLDRVLNMPSPAESDVADLRARLRSTLPEDSSPTVDVPPIGPGVSSTMQDLSSHPAWQDETAEAAREALASLSGVSATSAENGPDADEPESGRQDARTSADANEREEGEPTPLSHIVPRLERVLRLGCQSLDRHCLFDLEGSPRIGQKLLKNLIEPLEIVLRNALFFGVSPERPSTATMTLRLVDGTAGRRLELETDGVSPDLARIAMEALHEGTPPGSTTGLELLLDESRSTADHATRLRGYGAGLFEAREALERIGARLALDLPRDAGLRFIIHLGSRAERETGAP